MKLKVTKVSPTGKNLEFTNNCGQKFTLDKLVKNPPRGYHSVKGPDGLHLRSNPDGNKRNNLG